MGKRSRKIRRSSREANQIVDWQKERFILLNLSYGY